ncbi:MAG: colicin Z C-terminal domain-related protein [Ketobacteraceae bacterium]|nr:colicin Z C-terminal domain-related protein [Ketobacteraceae bacterium]
MSNFYDCWAPPGIWGPWVDIMSVMGPTTEKLSFKTQSNAKSSFSVEVEYFGSQWENDIVAIPGSGSFQFKVGPAISTVRVRCKSHSLGQTVRVEEN